MMDRRRKRQARRTLASAGLPSNRFVASMNSTMSPSNDESGYLAFRRMRWNSSEPSSGTFRNCARVTSQSSDRKSVV